MTYPGESDTFFAELNSEATQNCVLDEMAWAKPQYTREQVNHAGRLIAKAYSSDWSELSDQELGKELDEYLAASGVIDNYRSAHGHPLNVFQTTLRNSARRFDKDFIVAMRTKRLVSIANKLIRFPSMKLSQMQDIGGCRAVVKTVSQVRELCDHYENVIKFKHKCVSLDDYLKKPKISGYRGIHLVYRFFSDSLATKIYNDLKIEIQLRSRFQHAWATAVETIDMFTQQALKSSLGERDWERFFQLMGAAIAMREKQPPVPNTPTKRPELREELQKYAERLSVSSRLRGYGDALKAIRDQASPDARFYLLELDAKVGNLSITGFGLKDLAVAQERYAEAEKLVRNRPGTDAGAMLESW